MTKNQELYMKSLSEMDNDDLLEEFGSVCSAGDYDGCTTPFEDWQFEQCRRELYTRLVSNGFLRKRS